MMKLVHHNRDHHHHQIVLERIGVTMSFDLSPIEKKRYNKSIDCQVQQLDCKAMEKKVYHQLFSCSLSSSQAFFRFFLVVVVVVSSSTSYTMLQLIASRQNPSLIDQSNRYDQIIMLQTKAQSIIIRESMAYLTIDRVSMIFSQVCLSSRALLVFINVVLSSCQRRRVMMLMIKQNVSRPTRLMVKNFKVQFVARWKHPLG